jgi:hypothetical protein
VTTADPRADSGRKGRQRSDAAPANRITAAEPPDSQTPATRSPPTGSPANQDLARGPAHSLGSGAVAKDPHPRVHELRLAQPQAPVLQRTLVPSKVPLVVLKATAGLWPVEHRVERRACILRVPLVRSNSLFDSYLTALANTARAPLRSSCERQVRDSPPCQRTQGKDQPQGEEGSTDEPQGLR